MSALVIETTFKASLFLAAAATANILLHRRTSAAARHLLWTGTVIGLLLLPILSIALPSWEVPIRVAGSNAPIAARSGEPAEPTRAAEAAPGVESDSISPTSATAKSAAPLVPRAALMSWAAALSALYLSGVMLLVIRLVVERWTIGRLARRARETCDPAWTALLFECRAIMGVRRPVRLLRSLERNMPMAFGTRRPAILIPSVADTWAEGRRRAVLLHELAHIRRHDCLTQLIAAVTCVIYWIHPGVWWVARRLRTERELSCDDRVLAAGTRAREYAEHLLDLAYSLGGSRAPALAVAMSRPAQIEGRMLAVLDAARNRATPAIGSRLAGGALAATLLVSLAAAEATWVPAEVGADQKFADQSPATASANDAAQALPGTWEIRPSETARSVRLRLSERDGSSYGSTIAIEQLEGLLPALVSGAGGPARFSIQRDAGRFAFEGMFRSGVGAGTYTFTPSATFPAELTARGFARPTAADLYLLARQDIGLAFLDELGAQGYTRPDLVQLVRAGQHGVSLAYLREMGRAGYHLGQIEALMTQRDHGVSPEFIRELAAQGMTGLSADDLLRARDHGISRAYVSELKLLGYGPLSLEALIGARDHGIAPEYVRDLRQLGYRLTLAELTSARDHGVSPEYVRDLAELGYERLPLDALISARAHGISADYVRDLRQLGLRLTLAELTSARDHGVTAEYIRGMSELGYVRLSLDDLIRLRDHGVTPAYVREAKALGYSSPTLDELVSLRERGVTSSRVRSGTDRLRVAIDHLRALVDRWMK